LKRAIDCGRPHKNWRELVQDFAEQASDPSYDNSANWIGFLGKLEALQRRPDPEPQRADDSK
jgi:VanZ family protein